MIAKAQHESIGGGVVELEELAASDMIYIVQVTSTTKRMRQRVG